jgi:hypothetical protein
MAETRMQGYEELLRKLETLGQLKQVGAAVKAGTAHLAGKMKVYPAQRRLTRQAVYGRSFVSDRQRRYFFYALKNGLIQVPYRRGQSPGSRNLKQTWTVTMSNNDLTGEAGTNTPYAPLVQGEGTQTKYHAAVGWKTEQTVLAEESDKVVGLIHDAIEQAINE